MVRQYASVTRSQAEPQGHDAGTGLQERVVKVEEKVNKMISLLDELLGQQKESSSSNSSSQNHQDQQQTVTVGTEVETGSEIADVESVPLPAVPGSEDMENEYDLLSSSDPLLSQRSGERGDHIALSQTGAKWEVAGSKKQKNKHTREHAMDRDPGPPHRGGARQHKPEVSKGKPMPALT